MFPGECVGLKGAETPSKEHKGVITETKNWLKNAQEVGEVGTLRDPMPPMSTVAFICSY